MEPLEIFDIEIPMWAIATLIVFGTCMIMLLIKRFVLGHIQNAVNRTQYYLDSLLVTSLKVPATILIIVLNVLLLEYLLVQLQVTENPLGSYTQTTAKVLLIVATVLFLDRFSFGLLDRYARNSEALRSSASILTGIARGFVIGVGLLVLLGTLGISVTPIIASLGITSLAVALALQPTLENFFSGVQLVADKPIRVGDFIELDSGEQGFVEKIGWRSTWIKMLPNNTVIMPNSKLSQSKIINYFYPEKELSVPVEVSVHYNSDLDFVEQVTLEVARHILRTHKWGVPEYDTFVVFHTFDSSSINFTVMLRTREYFNQFFIKSEFIKALHKRYKAENIVIPYPIRAINTLQETARNSDALEESQPLQTAAKSRTA